MLRRARQWPDFLPRFRERGRRATSATTVQSSIRLSLVHFAFHYLHRLKEIPRDSPYCGSPK